MSQPTKENQTPRTPRRVFTPQQLELLDMLLWECPPKDFAELITEVKDKYTLASLSNKNTDVLPMTPDEYHFLDVLAKFFTGMATPE